MSEETQEVNYREEVLRLVAEGKIKQTNKYIEKASDETLEKIYKNYLAKQLDETNEHLTNSLIKQLSELMASLDYINDGESLEKELKDNELVIRDIKNLIGHITPYLPYVGLACAGICLGKRIMDKRR